MLLRQLVITLATPHRAFEQTRQLRHTEALARSLSVDLRTVHDTLLATSTRAAGDTSTTPERTPGEQPGIVAPEIQHPAPGKVANTTKTAESERPGGARTPAGGGGRTPETDAGR